jgi:hypothetical protein
MREDTDIGGRVSRFPTTRRSAVLAAGSEDRSERERAFELLVAAYWKPAYKYIRLKWGADNEQGKDLTQSFFARAFEKDFLRSYEPRKGSFRNFLRGIAFGLAVGLVLAYAVAAMPSATGKHYYFEIMLPGAIVGAIVGYATQKHGGVRTVQA